MGCGCHCGVPEAIETNASNCRWPAGIAVGYFEDLQIPGMARDQVAAAFDRAAASWREVCGIDLRRVADPAAARIVAGSSPIDGPGRVLAMSELPYNADASTVLRQRYDVPEHWTQRDQLEACICHELGHAIGLSHLPGTGALMEPTLSLGRHKPRPPDVAEARARYGPPETDVDAIAAQLRPYVVGPWADGLVAAARAIADGKGRDFAGVAAYAIVERAVRPTFNALVGPRIAGLPDAEAAQALLAVADRLARG
ncbi:MAG: matrixin family metalloprotease [Isosphaeraceae bacterium]